MSTLKFDPNRTRRPQKIKLKKAPHLYTVQYEVLDLSEQHFRKGPRLLSVPAVFREQDLSVVLSHLIDTKHDQDSFLVGEKVMELARAIKQLSVKTGVSELELVATICQPNNRRPVSFDGQQLIEFLLPFSTYGWDDQMASGYKGELITAESLLSRPTQPSQIAEKTPSVYLDSSEESSLIAIALARALAYNAFLVNLVIPFVADIGNGLETFSYTREGIGIIDPDGGVTTFVPLTPSTSASHGSPASVQSRLFSFDRHPHVNEVNLFSNTVGLALSKILESKSRLKLLRTKVRESQGVRGYLGLHKGGISFSDFMQDFNEVLKPLKEAMELTGAIQKPISSLVDCIRYVVYEYANGNLTVLQANKAIETVFDVLKSDPHKRETSQNIPKFVDKVKWGRLLSPRYAQASVVYLTEIMDNIPDH